MSADILTHQIDALRQRLAKLYRTAQTDTSPAYLLTEAFEELEYALERLQETAGELRRHESTLAMVSGTADAEQQYFRELFEQAPVAYLVTSHEGTIHRANQAARTMLDRKARVLSGWSLNSFIPEGERRAFRGALAQLCRTDTPVDLHMRLQQRDGRIFEAWAIIAVAHTQTHHSLTLRWILHNLSASSQPGATRTALDHQGIELPHT